MVPDLIRLQVLYGELVGESVELLDVAGVIVDCSIAEAAFALLLLSLGCIVGVPSVHITTVGH